MKFTNYGIDGPIKGICKQSAIWGRKGNQSVPLVYLQRPKWIKDDAAWKKVTEAIRLVLSKETEIK